MDLQKCILSLFVFAIPLFSSEARPEGRVVIVLSSEDCVYCPAMKEIVAKLWKEGHKAYVCDVDKSPDIAATYGYPNDEGLPQTCVMEKNKMLHRFIGRVSETKVRLAAGFWGPDQ